MTYRLSNQTLAPFDSEMEPSRAPSPEELAPLLAPAKLIPVREILHDKTLIPDASGIYGWWFDAPLSGVPLDGTLAIGAYRLLYVGIAPRKPTAAGSASRSTLRKRVTRNHLGNRIGRSTLRRSLAALLREELALEITSRKCKAFMPREQETLLTDWVAAHAAVSVQPHSSAWDVEDMLVRSGEPTIPLNLKGASHEFVAKLAGIRRMTKSVTRQ